jgi:peptidyl-prolyl cis-trans isomerase D
MIRFLQTPGPLKKIVLGGLLLVICGAMVISLTPTLSGSFFGGPGAGVVAKVGDQEVTTDEVEQTAHRIMQQQQQQMAARSLNLSQFMPYFRGQAARQLITQKSLLLAAEQLGLVVTDQELAEWLQHGPYSPYFFPHGQFIGNDRYEEFVERQLNMTVPQFEQAVKQDLLSGKLRSVVEGSATVSDQEVRQEYVKQNVKVKFDYAVLTTDDVMKQLHPSDTELKTYYDQNQKRYENSIPEKRQLSYAIIDAASIKDRVHVTPAELKQFYDGHGDQFRVPEEVKVRHILIKTPTPGPDGKVDPKGLEAARAKAQDILNKIRGGGDFADLAKKSSEDLGSAQAGGELGWIGKGRTVPEFEKAAFGLAPGQTSDLVQSSYGFHIIQTEEKHAPRLKSLDEVKAEIEPIVAQQDATAMTENVAKKVQADAVAGGMASAAAKNGLQLITPAAVGRADVLPGIGSAPELMTAVFGAPVNNPPQMSKLAQGYAVFQVTGVTPAATPSFDQIKARVEGDFKQYRAAQLRTQKLQELSDRAKADHNLKKAAAEVGAKFETSELVTASSQVPDLGALTGPAAIVFDMKPGDVSAPINSGPNGVVLAVVDKQEPSPADYAKQKDELRDSLLSKRRSEAVSEFTENLQQRLEKQGKIRINKEEMDKLTPKQRAG